jgi:Zn-dependent protease with chaperone function
MCLDVMRPQTARTPEDDLIMSIRASYFDGQNARRHDVELDIRFGRVVVTGDGIARDEPIGAVEITEPLGRTPRLIRFHDRAFCEIGDAAAFAALLEANHLGTGVVSQWEESRRWIAASAVAFVLMVWLGYRVGLPATAGFVADRLPAEVVDKLGAHVLTVLDRTVFEPSRISETRQAQLMIRFEELRLPGETDDWQHQIIFRSSSLGANAVALPSGVIVLTDDIVALAKDDRELLGVLAHEAGHVQRRHGIRSLLQDSAVALLITWYVGDVGTLAAAAPTAILQAKYSRDFEREADDYAAQSLRANGIGPEYLADILRRLDESPGGSSVTSYLSSHPATAERLERLRR